MYEFDLIYSEDLGKRLYSDREVHCCLNIYRKNINGLNKKPNYKLKDVKITEYRRGNKNNKIVDDFKYDIAICAWGSSTGQVLTEKFKFAQEFYITINNNKYKEKIIELIKNADWCKLYYQTKCPSLYQWQIYKYLKKEIPELEWY
jgi:hypothetical protein